MGTQPTEQSGVNVSWTADWYSDTYYDALEGSWPPNPIGPENGEERVMGGGSALPDLYAAHPASHHPKSLDFSIGFRCAKSP